MGRPIAVAHYPEGNGHATRMLAVGKALEAAGDAVAYAGGGDGSRLLEANGYHEFRPTAVDFVEDYQAGSFCRTLARSGPLSCRRVVDYRRWFARVRPAAVVTDDMFAAVAALHTGAPLFVVTHNAPSLYTDVVERAFTRLVTRYQLAASRAFLYPSVWPVGPDDPRGVTHIPPIALDAPAGRPGVSDLDVLLVPSVYSRGFDALAAALRAEGREVQLVGDARWQRVPALLPYLRAASVVVCSGYSTVMEAAVAGTPCVLYPFTDEQRGVAGRIARAGLGGFQVATSVEGVRRAVRHPPRAAGYPNGAGRAAELVHEGLAG